jgi:phosphatidate cytidylyltransferase
LATRIISALIALPVALVAMGLGGWAFAALVLFVGGVCLFEFMSMTLPGDRPAQALLTALGLTLMVGILTGAMASPLALVGLSVVPLLVLTFFLFRTGDLGSVAARLSFGFTGLFWAGGLLAITGALRWLDDGFAWLLLACVLAWMSDTGAYFAGRALGRHKLYEKVSPKKTWEGAVGGVLAATAGAFALSRLYGPQVDAVHLAILAPVAAAFGQVGDLAESLLKRSVGVKDSGKIMPGHGGLFDRVDALIFVGPVVLSYAVAVLGLPVRWLGSPW